MPSERMAYPNLCVAVVGQFKGSPEFQMAIDTVVARSLVREGEGGTGPSGVAAARRTEEKIIQGFQQSHYYKHEMNQYWDNGWMSFKYRAQELFPDVDFSAVKVGEDDISQTPWMRG
ncbi:hypothetical protein CsSME_00035798 [Camellia sinensis var. sinensis]